MDTRRLKKKIKRAWRKITGAPRRVYVHLSDRARERRVRSQQAKGLVPQSVTLRIQSSRHDVEVKRGKNG